MTRAAIAVAVLLALGAAGCASTSLYDAARSGDAKRVAELLDRGAPIDETSNGGYTALAAAAADGNDAMVKELLRRGADPNTRLDKIAPGVLGYPEPVFQAALNGHASTVRLLLASGAKVTPRLLNQIPNERMRALMRGEETAPAPAAPTPTGRLGLALGTTHDGTIVVTAVLPGSPAAEAGFQGGDHLVAIGETVVQTLTLNQAAALLRGEPGTTVAVTYQRGDAEPLMVTMTRQAPVAPVPPPATAPSTPAVVSDVDRAGALRAERPDDYALVVGIESYQSLPKADYGQRDAETVRKHLAALGVPARNIIALEGSAATGNKLKSYLQEWLPLNVKADSTLYVYYSGHGAPDPKSGDAYLVPWDGDPKFLKSTAYPLKQFYADLAKIKARRIIVALDACFSGAGGRSVLAQGARPLVVKVDEGAPQARGITVLAAASGDEITGSLDEQGHGLFTYYFLKGLSGAAKNTDGQVTPKSLFDYLKPRVQDEARRQNREQTPTMLGDKSDAPLASD